MTAADEHADGLTESEATGRLARDGPNELPRSKPKNILRLLREIVTEPIFLLLVACGVIYMLLGDKHEAMMLLGFVFVVMGISFYQQRRTERSLEALRDISSPRSLIWREGVARRIPGTEVVCGDIVLLAEGDRVPADILLTESSNLNVDESMLTGESVPVSKYAQSRSEHMADAPNPVSLVFSGTLITQGTARGYVIATGERSALGKIGKSLSDIEVDVTPIQKETGQVVKRVAVAGLLLAAALAISYGVLRGEWLLGLLAGLTLAMAILPEELPVVLTLFLALGAWRLSGEKILARNIPAVELLGATTLLCVDKTGTLTLNRMTVCQLWSPAATYDNKQSAAKEPLSEALHPLLEYAVLASHRQAFDPMETAIASAGLELLAGTEHLHSDWTLLHDYPLSKELLAMSRAWQSPDLSTRMIAAKGAPEAIIDLCHLDLPATQDILKQVAVMAAQGLRVIGVAQVKFGAGELPANQHDFAFEFLGLVALQDPLRPDVPRAIHECHDAGIRVVMITGDHPETAMSIARQAGLLNPNQVITGTDLLAMNDEALKARLGEINVFCRVRPEQKLRLVQAFRSNGEIVAMTGDGVNDAPALKAANIGVAMGGRGTDVARESAALVLQNDDFSSLVTAVMYGRRVFANLRKAIIFILAVHLPIVGLSVLPIILGWPVLLMPVHILFLQLIIDPACSVVFEAEPLEADAMKAKPRSPTDRLFDRRVLTTGLLQGFGLTVVLAALYVVGRKMSLSDDLVRTVMFATLVLSSLGLIYSNRSMASHLFSRRTVRNEYLGWMTLFTVVLLAIVIEVPAVSSLFLFQPLNAIQAALGLVAACCSLVWFEIAKLIRNDRKVDLPGARSP